MAKNNNKKGSYRNGSKGNSRGKSKFNDKEVIDKSSPNKTHDNDVSWYASHPQLLIDSSSHAYGLPLGAKYSYSENIDLSENVDVSRYHYVPGIMSLGFIPSVGVSTDGNSPINVIARNVYSYVVHANSRNTRYNAPDIMMYFMAVDSLHMLHAWMTRAYGFMNYATPFNRYLVKSLVNSMGFDYSSLSKNMADFRGLINTLGVKLGALAVPDSIPYFKRHRWMVSHVWMDSPNVKAQLYHYNPEAFYQYEEMFDEEESGHAKHEWGNLNLYTVEGTQYGLVGLSRVIDDLYNPVIESEDCNIIAGDILKAFGADNILVVPQIPTDFTMTPEYNIEVLTQIHNYRGMGYISGRYGMVDQDPERNIIIHNPEFLANIVGSDMNVVFDLPFDNPTPADTMVASRMTVIGDPVTDGAFYSKFRLSSCGSEIPTKATLWKYTWDDANGAKLISSALTGDVKVIVLPGTESNSSSVVLDQMAKLTLLCDLTNFNYHPLVRLWAQRGQDNDAGYNFIATHGDITNFTIMTAQDLRKMHEVALLSEYAVPAMGANFNLR